MDKFIGDTSLIIQAWVEVGIITKHHQSGSIYKAEVQIRLPGRGIRAEAVNEDIFLAIDEIKKELKRQIEEYKEKTEAKQKRGGRILKKILHLSPLARLWRKGRIREEGL